MVPAVIAYQKWVRGRLTMLQSQTDVLARRLGSGDRAGAQAAWRTADHTWHTMGGAYGAFGATGEAIDGDAHGLPKGVIDPAWTGLLRIEYGLWHGESTTSLSALGNRLRTDLGRLAGELASTQFQPVDVVKRAHEISEDTLQETLTGNHDYGAHVQLDEALAELDGTTQVLASLRPLLAPRYAGLAQVDALITKSAKDIRAQRGWQAPAQGAAPSAGHALVDSDIAQLAELLAPVPTRLEPRVA
nr:EfeM/EfeO family lipoprotein [Flexivirga aerilata]